MRLDRFEKASATLPRRARTMGLLAKIGLLYRSKRLIVALVIIGFASYAAYDGFVKKGFALGDVLRFGEVTAAATDAQAMAILVGLASIIAALLIVTGVRRIWRAVAVIERGISATAEVVEVTRHSTRTNKVTSYTWEATCRFQDASGKPVELEVIGPAEDSLEKGDRLAVVYDPGTPENAVAIRALPFFVKTVPPLEANPPAQPPPRS